MAEPFFIPRLWAGGTVVILAGGPSLTTAQVRTVARARLSGRCSVMCVNDAIFLAWWADWLHGCDRKWWQWHKDTAVHFGGIKTTLEESTPREWGVRFLKNTGKSGFDPDPRCVKNGANGVYQCIHSAIHTGAKKIILVGVDMKVGGNDLQHWFGHHPVEIRSNYGTTMLPHFKTLIPALKEHGVEVVNCTPGSALGDFRRATLEDELP